jgi:uncharacterized membrane protein
MSQQSDKAALERRGSADPGEQMNVRHVHAAIWREEAEPAEVVRRTPVVLKHFYFLMFVWLVFYLINWMGNWRWDEYEPSPTQRSLRDRARDAAATAQPSP